MGLKATYHHGELRQALIDATRKLVHLRGADGFSLSDACRQAGVSTAAPYRHFADKQAILAEVAAQGFVDMTNRARDATAVHPPGAMARIVAVGQVYLTFAMQEPALFRIMFGQNPDAAPDDLVTTSGKACFGYVLGEVEAFCHHHRVDGDARLVALQLWTLVHGAASLTIDGDYAKVAPDLDIAHLMAVGAERLLFSLPRRPLAPGSGQG